MTFKYNNRIILFYFFDIICFEFWLIAVFKAKFYLKILTLIW